MQAAMNVFLTHGGLECTVLIALSQFRPLKMLLRGLSAT